MPTAAIDDPILKRFRAALDELYGDRLERVVLFGSRARGDAREDADYEVAVFLKSLADRWQEVDRIVPLVTDILYERTDKDAKTQNLKPTRARTPNLPG